MLCILKECHGGQLKLECTQSRRDKHFQQFMCNPEFCTFRYLQVRLTTLIEFVWKHVSCLGKINKNFTNVTLMICLFGERFFWHYGMLLFFEPSFVNQCKNFFIIGFSNHSSENHRLDLVRALMWSSRVLSTQAYYYLSLTRQWANSSMLTFS